MSKLSDPLMIRQYIDQIAQHRGWVVNPDTTLTDPICQGMATQVNRFGKPYCPCRDVDGGETDRDIICPCAYAKEDILEAGQCFCGLFLSPTKDAGTIGSIPERRL